MTDGQFLADLNDFFGRAALATYAATGARVSAQRPGFEELEYRNGIWAYRDSYAGYLRSRGQEVIWYEGRPVWTQSYGGGMEGRFQDDCAFAGETFAFLKAALASGEKRKVFQPRGPMRLTERDWEYLSYTYGDISEFSGAEEIRHKGAQVFTHQYFGGLIVNATDSLKVLDFEETPEELDLDLLVAAVE